MSLVDKIRKSKARVSSENWGTKSARSRYELGEGKNGKEQQSCHKFTLTRGVIKCNTPYHGPFYVQSPQLQALTVAATNQLVSRKTGPLVITQDGNQTFQKSKSCLIICQTLNALIFTRPIPTSVITSQLPAHE